MEGLGQDRVERTDDAIYNQIVIVVINMYDYIDNNIEYNYKM